MLAGDATVVNAADSENYISALGPRTKSLLDALCREKLELEKFSETTRKTHENTGYRYCTESGLEINLGRSPTAQGLPATRSMAT